MKNLFLFALTFMMISIFSIDTIGQVSIVDKQKQSNEITSSQELADLISEFKKRNEKARMAIQGSEGDMILSRLNQIDSDNLSKDDLGFLVRAYGFENIQDFNSWVSRFQNAINNYPGLNNPETADAVYIATIGQNASEVPSCEDGCERDYWNRSVSVVIAGSVNVGVGLFAGLLSGGILLNCYSNC